MKVLIPFLIGLLVVGCGEKDEWPELKKCVRCKETDIKYWADVCKHCGKDPDGPHGAEKRAELTKIWLEEKSESNNRNPPASNSSPEVPKHYDNGDSIFSKNFWFRKESLLFLCLFVIPVAIAISFWRRQGSIISNDHVVVPIVERFIRYEIKKPTGKLNAEDLDKVAVLDLSSTSVIDEDLKELANLRNLSSLDLSGTNITKAQIDELQKALPECKIDHNAK